MMAQPKDAEHQTRTMCACAARGLRLLHPPSIHRKCKYFVRDLLESFEVIQGLAHDWDVDGAVRWRPDNRHLMGRLQRFCILQVEDLRFGPLMPQISGSAVCAGR